MPPRTLSRDEVRDVDRRAVEEYGMPSVILMENAGRGAAELLMQLGIEGPLAICAGRGNNAGDGFVIARHLENAGYEVRVLLFCQTEASGSRPVGLKGDAATNYQILEKAGTPIRALGRDFDTEDLDRELAQADWVVDALLGTGVRGELRPPFPTIIERINAAGKKVLAVDLPSGMDCDTGEPLGVCIQADHTATFVARKTGFDAPGADELTGQVHVLGIGVPRVMLER